MLKKAFHSFCSLLFAFSSLLHSSEIAVVTVAAGTEYNKIVQPGIKNKNFYCARHGYDFICHEQTLDPERPIPWSKVVAILKAMENPDHKWIFWTDADALVMNHAIPLEDLIDENYDFIISKDMGSINSGHFLIKNSEWSRKFLHNVYNHTECIHDCWWEQRAIIYELDQHPELLTRTKFIPQRMFNSYPEELGEFQLTTLYQKGDFILHFPSARNRLSAFFDKYPALCVDDLSYCTLDHYLGMYGYQLSPMHSGKNEGYVTETQKKQFNEVLQSYSNITKIAEVGLNGGHSAEIFLKKFPHLKKFVSFDIQSHPYVSVAREYLSKKYKGTFEFVEGDSTKTAPKYFASNSHKFDLVYLDGGTTYENALQDILNFHHMTEHDGIVWIDDYTDGVKSAVNVCVERGIIKIVKVYYSDDPIGGQRAWVEARYIK